MSTLDRYLLREVAVPFAAGLGLFFVVVSFAQLLKVSDAVTGLGVTGGEVLTALAYSIPPLLGLLVPVSLLFATLLAVGRMSADREIVGLLAGGVAPDRLLRVPLALGMACALISGMALVWGEPWGVAGLRRLMAESAQRALTSGVRVNEFHEWVPGVTFMATREKRGELFDVVFMDRRDSKRPLVISAKRGRLAAGTRAADLVFDLKDGTILMQERGSDTHRAIKFERTLYRLDVGKLVGNKARTLSSVQEKTLVELWYDGHDEAISRSKRALNLVTFHRKMALPLAAIIFSLLAVPLAMRAAGGARARG
ncbi:MAG: LptF/LptG family permease, partial [Deltaproteobacteria bacterium]|nr:LptF/LptG family permease [Deltaproteobacteria bacterium]